MSQSARPLRCGIIGLGRIAWRHDGGKSRAGRSVTHASCFERHPATQLVVAYDISSAARSDFVQGYRASKGVAIAQSLEEFFDERLDLVSICSPSESHSAHLLACFARKIPFIWLEKPVTQDLDAYRHLLRVWSDLPKRPRVSVNYFRRNLPQFRYLIERIREAEERLALVEVTYSRGLAVNGVHMLDLLGACFETNEPPQLDWVSDVNKGNQSFAMRINGVRIMVSGMDLPYHCIEIRATFNNRRITIARGGLETWEEERISNDDYPGFFMLGKRKPAAFPDCDTAATSESIYPNLCNLVADGEPLQSSLVTAGFSQGLLARLQGGPVPSGAMS